MVVRVALKRTPIMKESERKNRPCAACGKPVREATIVCGGPYPDAPLCMTCGTRRDYDDVVKMIDARRLKADPDATGRFDVPYLGDRPDDSL